MISDYFYLAHSVPELNALIDQDRIGAAAMAEAIFHQDIHGAIRTITEINAIAVTKISADTQVASARLLIDAEVASAHLAADAQLAVVEYKAFVKSQSPSVPLETVASMVHEINERHVSRLSERAAESIKAIEANAQSAIAKLKEIGAAAIGEIHDIASEISAGVETAAAQAAEELIAFRLNEHTFAEVAEEADKAAQVIEEAAMSSTNQLRNAVAVAIEKIQTAADESAGVIAASVKAATERIADAKAKALRTVAEVVRFRSTWIEGRTAPDAGL